MENLKQFIKNLGIDRFLEYIKVDKNNLNKNKPNNYVIESLCDHFKVTTEQLFRVVNEFLINQEQTSNSINNLDTKKELTLNEKIELLSNEDKEALNEYVNFLIDSKINKDDKETAKRFTKKFIAEIKEDN